tara:strand:- start:310 stop:612 length:303 start_codon:yes stop_codon:yes gene_type:complete
VLNASQRKSLRRQAHHLKPTVFVGKEGLTASLIDALKESIGAHELIKVRFVDNKENKKELAAKLTDASDSELVGMIGHLAILYREHPDEEKRKIKLSEPA